MLYNPFTLEGKTILITGASSGIGQTTAIECSKMGASVFLTGRNEERLIKTLEELEPGEHKYVVADLTDPEQLKCLVDSIPKIDGLVNNAGASVRQLLQFIKEEDLSRILNINLQTPISLTRSIIKAKKFSKGGSIVFTSSISKYCPTFGLGAYSATKGGLSSFMKAAALELASKKIRCNAVLPGMIETPLIHGESVTPEQLEVDKQLYPLKEYGNPRDVAYGIIYLLSDASQWVTGSELVIDGGRSLK